jgi:hypothetical protein
MELRQLLSHLPLGLLDRGQRFLGCVLGLVQLFFDQ